MKKSWWLINAVALMMVVMTTGCQTPTPGEADITGLPYYAEATFTPHWLSENSPELDTFHQVTDFSLLNQSGEVVNLDRLKDKVFVVDFFFTSCPGICPKMTTNMATLQEAFGKEDRLRLLSHTVMPKYDSVAVLKEYAEAKGIDAEKWWLLTGERDEIYRLGRETYFVEEDLGLEKNPDDFLHTENFVLIDQNRHIRGIYNGLNRTAVEQLKQDITLLLSAK